MITYKSTKKTYKEQWIDRITKEILKQDKISNNYKLDEYERWKASKLATGLRKIRINAESLHGKHFIPSRFPSAEFLSISLSLRNKL